MSWFLLTNIITILRRELIYIWYYSSIQFQQIFQYWAMGILIGSLISVFGKEKISGMMESLKKSKLGILGIIPASLLGIASPLCMYGTIPIVASLAKKGLREDWTASFMMCSILLNPQLLIYSGALGNTALTLRFFFCLLGGIGAGLGINIFFKEKSFYNYLGFEKMASRDTDPRPIIRLIKNIWRNVKITGPYFLFGILLTSLYQIHVPQDIMAGIFGSNKGFGVLMAAAVGVPLYICGGGTIPLLITWMNSGMSMGSAVAFMITGQSLKITNLSAVKIILGKKHFIIYILFCILFAVASGMVVDVFV